MRWVATSVTVANQFTVHEVIQVVNNIVLSEVLWRKVNGVVKINKYVKKKNLRVWNLDQNSKQKNSLPTSDWTEEKTSARHSFKY